MSGDVFLAKTAIYRNNPQVGTAESIPFQARLFPNPLLQNPTQDTREKMI
jgi:hypothetical protein